MPSHPTLYRFIACLRTTVVSDGIAITAAAEGGHLKARKMDTARRVLLESAKKVEEDYTNGLITPDDVLLAAANHFNNEKVTSYLANVAESIEGSARTPVDHDGAGQDDDDDDLLPDVDDANGDERQALLNYDPDLEDVETEHVWVSSVWPFAASETQIASNVIGRAEDIEKVVAVVCPLCYDHEERLIAFDNCEHLSCKNCFTRCKAERNARCPICKVLMGTGPGKVVNVGTLKFARQKEVSDNFGLSRTVVEASAAADGQRPADISEAEQQRIRDQEAIRQAQQAASSDSSDSSDNSQQPQPGTSRGTSRGFVRTRGGRGARRAGRGLSRLQIVDLVNDSDDDFI